MQEVAPAEGVDDEESDDDGIIAIGELPPAPHRFIDLQDGDDDSEDGDEESDGESVSDNEEYGLDCEEGDSEEEVIGAGIVEGAPRRSARRK